MPIRAVRSALSVGGLSIERLSLWLQIFLVRQPGGDGGGNGGTGGFDSIRIDSKVTACVSTE